MTSCIAAIGRCADIGKDCEAIVFATDHMITIGNVGQFEHSIEKYRIVNRTTVAMLSGDALLFDEVLRGTTDKDDFDTIAQKIHQNMKEIRDGRIKNLIFESLKIDFAFLRDLLKAPTHNPTVQKIMTTIEQFKLS